MNTKMMTVVSTLAFVLATSASAQVISILPGGRGNLIVGMPTNLPGPIGNAVISPRISLPSPLLTPAFALTPAPVLAAAAVTPVLPVAAIPQSRILAVHENVALPYPALRAQLAAPAKDSASTDAAREKLEDLFDGRRQPSEKNSNGLSPVRSDRHQSLPENELEREIGAY